MDSKSVHKVLDEFISQYSASIPANIDKLKNMLDLCHSILVHLKTTVGDNNEDYLTISSEVVRVALNFIVTYVNSKTRALNEAKSYDFIERNDLKNALSSLDSLFVKIDLFDKNEDCKEYYLRNRQTFNKLYSTFCIGNSNTFFIDQKTRRNIYTNNGQNKNRSNKKENDKVSKIIGVIGISICSIIALWAFIAAAININNKPQGKSPETQVATNNSEAGTVDYSNNDSSSDDGEATYESSQNYTTIQYGTGDKPFADFYGSGVYDRGSRNSLKIENGSDTDALLFLESLDGKKIRHVYIMRGESFTMTKIPGGQYIMKVMQGNSWNPDKYNGDGAPSGGFMEDNSISKSEENDPFVYPSSSSQKYREYSITLYKVRNGNMASENIDESELFN